MTDTKGDAVYNWCTTQNITYVDISIDLEQPGYRLLPYDSHPSELANLK